MPKLVTIPPADLPHEVRRSLHTLPAIVILSLVTGTAVALFLWLLDEATRLRLEHSWLLYLLPVGGLLVVALYSRGGSAERGNNLVVESLHRPGTVVPARMGPLVLAGTVITHLFGGSAGREGTAVQIGGSIAGGMDRVLRLDHDAFRLLVMAGIAAGFGAVFGTPLAGAVFAVEVGTIGRFELHALPATLLAAFLADWTTSAWGIGHTQYAIAGSDPLDASLAWILLRVALAGVAFGVASVLFTESIHLAGQTLRRLVASPWLRPMAGGLAVIVMAAAIGSRDYLGLGVSSPDTEATSIVSSFDEQAGPFAWLAKIAFTALTLGSGFKGGEVTPLFFVGATLGSALSGALDMPVDLLAGCGFVAVFGAAANTPVASSIMGVELFGAGHAPSLAVACIVARVVSGRGGIYAAQRFHRGSNTTRALTRVTSAARGRKDSR